MIDTQQPLDKKELAKFLKVSSRFIELEMARGRLRAIKFSNRCVRFTPSDVQRWLDNATINKEAA
jgi:excisionase family DNA binding protein